MTGSFLVNVEDEEQKKPSGGSRRGVDPTNIYPQKGENKKPAPLATWVCRCVGGFFWYQTRVQPFTPNGVDKNFGGWGGRFSPFFKKAAPWY
jgi:hypothetical protein